MKVKNIACIGAGFVGGPTMAVIALKCPEIRVTVLDSNEHKIDLWNGNLDKLPVYEPGLSEIIAEVRDKNLFFSTDMKNTIDKAEMIFMALIHRLRLKERAKATLQTYQILKNVLEKLVSTQTQIKLLLKSQLCR